MTQPPWSVGGNRPGILVDVELRELNVVDGPDVEFAGGRTLELRNERFVEHFKSCLAAKAVGRHLPEGIEHVLNRGRPSARLGLLVGG